MLGYPAQALQRSREFLALARELSHPVNLAYALFWNGVFLQLRRDVSETREQAEACQRLSAELGLLSYLAGGSVLQGWALAERGNLEEGLSQMRQGLADSATSPRFWRVYFHALLAEVYGKAGKVEDAFAAMAEALKEVEDRGIGFYEPELHRVKGELLLAGGPENLSDTEAAFRQAIASARRQRSKSLELRAVVGLCRLLQEQGKEDEARPMLAEIYGWFTEGVDTVDLQEAKALLEVIS
jgi:predicted ATPase